MLPLADKVLRPARRVAAEPRKSGARAWAMDGRGKKGDRKACALGGTAARGQAGRRGAPKSQKCWREWASVHCGLHGRMKSVTGTAVARSMRDSLEASLGA